jgi:hypothetical protein
MKKRAMQNTTASLSEHILGIVTAEGDARARIYCDRVDSDVLYAYSGRSATSRHLGTPGWRRLTENLFVPIAGASA